MTSPGHLGFWARPDDERVAAFAALRRLDRPQWVPFCNRMPFTPTDDGFWAVVRHADVVEASRRPDRFANEPTVASLYDMPPWLARYLGSMINIDGPRHKVVARAFSPQLLPHTSASAAPARTSASARTWPGWRPARCCASCSRGSPRSGWSASRSGCCRASPTASSG